MKRYLLKTTVLLLFVAGFLQGNVQAQCSGGTLSGTIAPTVAWQTIGCVTGGQYYNFTGIAGNVYTFTFCNNGGSASWDTQLTVLSNFGGALAYNDDACGVSSEVSWTCPANGTYRILINRFFCGTNGVCATLAYRCSAPTAGGSCASPYIIPAIPFNQTGLTTCGQGDDFSSASACGSLYMGGDDMVFTYTSTGNEYINVQLSNTATYTGVFVTDGCPSNAATNCLPPQGGGGGACSGGGGATNESFSGNPYGTWFLPTAGTYYITVSTWPSPQCTPFDISVTPGSGSGGGGVGNACYTLNQSIPYSPYPYNTGTVLSFPDDQFSSIVPIGFTFCFMGSMYSNMVVSSNGYVTFETACTGQFSNYTTNPIPATAPDDIRNAIMLAWQDIDPGVGGTIRYQLGGVAPFRRMVVNFFQIPMFSVACNSQLFTGQIVMYETTNNIELYIQNKTVCPSWNSGNAVQGLHDASGTVAVTVPGRNNTNWTTTNDAVRFTWNCGPCIFVSADYLNFSGSPLQEGNLITWETLIEEDIERFALERSIDGTEFSEVGQVTATGNIDQGAAYSMVDPQPFRPRTHYRLREISSNGEVNFSEVISVMGDAVEAPLRNLYVDYNAQQLKVETEFAQASQDLKYTIHDGVGRIVKSGSFSVEAGLQTTAVDIADLSIGYYIFKLTNGSSVYDAHKFAINR